MKTMNRRVLGRSGISVSEIAFGGVEIGMPYGIGVESRKDMLSEGEAVHLLHAAVDSGINFFDTARMYGDSETIMGKAFKDRRQKIVLSTKCVHLREADGRLPDSVKLKRIITDSLAASLKALQTDYVDLFMLHTADEEILSRTDVGRQFADLKDAGIIRATGASTYLPEETEKVIADSVWDVIQMPFNLMDQRQEAFFSLASKKGIALVVRSVLMKGLLSDRGSNLHPALKQVEDHINSYRALLRGTAGSLPALAAKFALSFDEVSAILIGIDKMEYLYGSVEYADGAYLDNDRKRQLRNLAYPDPGFLNLHTWSQKGWLK
jgi:1-deoxyxylulose-5-phosphate synthase